MKLCPNCDQPVAEEITICPSCGNDIGEGRKYIDDYRIVDVLHEGHASFLCRAIRERTNEHVMIRLFTQQSGVDSEVASRLMREIEELKKLPDEGFVRHHAIRRSSDGLWYRISEWVDTESWGSLLASGRLSDRRLLFDLFYQMASAIAVLHKEGYFIPHLILNDIIVVTGANGALKVKIDYKLSRFFDPKLDRPGPMLKRLLSCHPDIIHQRPLDFRSDIWSLGKVFVELLTADLECMDFRAKVDELQLPSEAQILLKVMLADDPDMRPRSMIEVADSLARIKEKELEMAEEPAPEVPISPQRTIRSLQKRISLLAVVVILLSIFGILSWFQFGQRKNDVGSLEAYANKYAPSVAFVLVEYWLKKDDVEYYRNMAEGTAFLVDNNGYMLTGRHVVCPWLEDMTLYATVQQLLLSDITPQFGYRIFLWFEGKRAFNRAARMLESSELTDIYLVDLAFSSESSPRVSVAGVPKPPVQTRQVITSPLKDDFAVLKIEKVPEGLNPLPLDLKMDPQRIPKLSRLITLGFPLGSRTQADTVNVSVTSGHVRRSFENMLQVDASIYGGNSGGPVIDMQGRVIGIVSGVAMDYTQGFLPMATPRWDLGMVLPITKAVEFLKELKAGQIKWNGELDFSVEDTLKKIREKAIEGRWAEAQTLADEELKRSQQPSLVMAAGIMHLCSGDIQGAKKYFSQSLSMDAENFDARLMLYLIDWMPDEKSGRAYRDDLLALDWRSPAEFQGYLVRVLEGMIDEDSALDGWYTSSEKSWLNYVVGLLRSKQKDWAGAEKLMREAILLADTNAWEFFLASSSLEEIQKHRRESLKEKKLLAQYSKNVEAFEQKVQKSLEDKKSSEEKLGPLRTKLLTDGTSIKDKLAALQEIHGMYPENRQILVGLAYYSAADEAWAESLAYIRTFLKTGGRQYSDRMGLGLMEAGILHYQGQEVEAQTNLEAFLRRTRDPWYQTISEYLLGKQSEDLLKKQAGETPENLITASTVLGFWSEGSGDKNKAIKHYKEALGTFLDTWLEYDFAKERIKRLKQPAG
ncbi:MAG: trypsin-like peptidase domain-containing protein [Desulfobacterales bacterium]|nr:MAG: trypsin-like peptidase domain-containing protein [Desulfobacterales bacterium]